MHCSCPFVLPSLSQLRVRLVREWITLYPPFVGAGIRVRVTSRSPLRYRVRMPLRRWNRGAVGTHFGGSLFAMADPFYMLILMAELGRGYIVWDAESRIKFLRPARSTVVADFAIDTDRIDEIRARCDAEGSCRPTFETEIEDARGVTVARVHKELSVRRAA